MSDKKQTKAYAFQPGAPGENGGFIFGIGGTDAWWLSEARFRSKDDAEKAAAVVNRMMDGLKRLVMEALLK